MPALPHFYGALPLNDKIELGLELPPAVSYKHHLDIAFYRNIYPNDWNLEINGAVFQHVSTDELESIVEGSLVRLICLEQNDEDASKITLVLDDAS
jgi:hypothetical protein